MKSKLEVHEGYRPHDADSLRGYLAGIDQLCASLGGDPAGWTVEEVGDGNLNLVFKVRGASGGLAVKQLWLFWVAPIVGALLAGIAWKWLGAEKDEGKS